LRKDGLTDRHDEAFRNFESAPKKATFRGQDRSSYSGQSVSLTSSQLGSGGKGDLISIGGATVQQKWSWCGTNNYVYILF
jgi:hypothetical protein